MDPLGGKFVERAEQAYSNTARTLGGAAITRQEYEQLKTDFTGLNALAKLRVGMSLGGAHPSLVTALDGGADGKPQTYSWYMDHGGRWDGRPASTAVALAKSH